MNRKLSPEKTIIRRLDVQAQTGLSKSAIYQLLDAGKFPKQVRIMERACGWIQSEVDEWVRQRIDDRDRKG